MITGNLPFPGQSDFVTIQRIKAGDFQYHPVLDYRHAGDLVAMMLTPDPSQRANLEDLQTHPWAWSDKPLTAMLLLPLANQIVSRKKELRYVMTSHTYIHACIQQSHHAHPERIYTYCKLPIHYSTRPTPSQLQLTYSCHAYHLSRLTIPACALPSLPSISIPNTFFIYPLHVHLDLDWKRIQSSWKRSLCTLSCRKASVLSCSRTIH